MACNVQKGGKHVILLRFFPFKTLKGLKGLNGLKLILKPLQQAKGHFNCFN